MIDETVAEIEAMRTHSSSEVAIKAARALLELTEREYATVEELTRDLERNAGALRRANPSHASLENAMREITEQALETEHDSVSGASDALVDAVERVTAEIESAKGEAAAAAATLLSDGESILTHDYSTTVLEAIEQAAADGAYLDVYVTEARPRFLGRKTARQLGAMDRVDATLIVDSAAGHYLEACDRVLTGMTCIVDDTLYNRVGTYPIAAAAADAGVPMTVTGSSAKVIEQGFVFENEYREGSELLREPAEGFDIGNPTYDATPLSLVDRVVTDEDGIDTGEDDVDDPDGG